jgi:hypothetical protein
MVKELPFPPLPAKGWKRWMKSCLENFLVFKPQKVNAKSLGEQREVENEPECGWIPGGILKPELLFYPRGR